MFRIAAPAVFSAGLVLSSAGFAATPVASVTSYAQGSGVSGFSDPLNAVGFPDPLTGESIGFPNILSPFSPAFESNELVGIGAGGHITLRFDQPLFIGQGLELGVFTNVGLQDAAYPNGQNTSPAGTFDPAPRIADVEVSRDGVLFAPAARHTFNVPTNYYSDAPSPYLTTGQGLSVADFGATFAFGLDDFSGRDWAQTNQLFHGTAGGNWIDADAAVALLGGVEFQFVRLSIPSGGIAGSDNRLYIDAVFAADNALIPEPGALALLAGLSIVSFRRR